MSKNSFTCETLRLIALFPVLFLSAQAQMPAGAPVPQDSPHREWKAFWITHPTAPLREPVVLHFRRALKLDTAPSSYIVRVSADNRFILWVNGKRAGDGPARGDLGHWRYERFDLAPLLQAGDNLITATVWNFGVYSPLAQMSDRTAFLLESEATGDQSISTPDGWQVEAEPGQRPIPRVANGFWAYMAAGTGEELDAAKFDWNWQAPNIKGGNWLPVASPIRESIYPNSGQAESAGSSDAPNSWALVPDELPHMAYTDENPGEIVRLDDIAAEQPSLRGFPGKPAGLPPHTHVHVLLDRKTLTTAYPELTVSGGKGAKIVLTYSEALYDDKQQKGDRDAVENRIALGLSDSFLPDGGDHRTFQPLWWRTWRYINLDITTGDQPLTLESLQAHFTAYPFEERARFESNDPDLAKIWEISWRTARLDAHETYMDTPYYEQLQYLGDTRIQALISYAVANDDRLARQALRAFDQSRISEGITRSRYPSSLPQNIPTFSLLWIGMLHDWWMYRPDPAPVRESLPGTRTVLDWFARHERPDGLLEKLPWWSFVDWVVSGEIPTYSKDSESCITSLHYLGALRDAADLEANLGDPLFAERYRARASHVSSGIYGKCWNAGRRLLADNPDQTVFSQQSNLLGVLYDAVPREQQQDLMRRMFAIEPGTTRDGVLSASYYFRFYFARALDHAGMSDEYLDSLTPWRKLLPLHFSTWPEQPGDTRSDSHAWSAHPIYDLLTLVAGIQPGSPGFKTVRIEPHLGNLPAANAVFPHPLGAIDVHFEKGGEGLAGNVTLPAGLSGEFIFRGKSVPLHPGANAIRAP